MNFKSNARAKLLLPITLLCAVVASVLRALSLLFFFDSDIAQYTSGAALPIISNLFMGASIIFFCIYSILCFKGKDIHPASSPSVFSIASALITALASLFVAFYPPSNSIAGVTVSPLLGILTVALSIATAVYFVLTVTDANPILKAVFGILVILRLVIMLTDSYFAKGMSMNAPNKVLFGLTCVVIMLFIISELKLFAHNCRSWLYIFSAASAATVCLAMSVPSVIAYHARVLSEANDTYAEYYFFFGIALYAFFRLMTAIKEKEAKATVEAFDNETNI